ncbi:f-box/kelch-repeat protein, partial [Quercus suber]
QASMVHFPSDLHFDIVSRLPVKSLLRFKCVSQLWCNMIDDPSLAYMHLTRSVEEPKMLILDHQTKNPDTSRFTEVAGGFLKADMKLVTKFATGSAFARALPLFAQASMVHFPSDLHFDIVSRLPVKSLLRFKCVSQLWCNMIDDPSLAYMHLTRSVEEPKMLILDHQTKNPDTSRQEVIALPPHRASYTSMSKYGLGFDSSTNTYKVVRVFSRGGSFNMGADVYTLGTSSWRPISKGPLCRLAGRPIFACGALHWFVHHYVDRDALKGKYIVSFDVGKEEFGWISPPKFYSSSHLLDLGGNLAMVDRSFDSHIEIWVMKEYKKKEWVKEYKIDIYPPLGISDSSLVEVIGLWEFGEILLRNRESFISYNLKTGVKRYIEILGHDVEVLYHMGSLLSISKFQTK